MRTATIVVLALVAALAAGSVIPPRERKVADKDFLIKQKNIIQLFIRPHQQNIFKEQVEIGNSYDLEANLNNYREPQEVKHFLNLYKHGQLLARDATFSMVNRGHVYLLERLYDVFYLAKDYDTFYKTACWARDRVHHAMFVYALSVAVIHRPDTHDIILPPPYEVYPELFVDTIVIQKAYEARMTNQQGPVIIPYNYTSHIRNGNDLINYFTEDVGLSTYLTYLNYEYPTWMDVHKYGLNVQRHGEIFYYTRQQLLARYQLERLSTYLPGVETIHLDLDSPVMSGYNPQLRYKNGQEMPARPEGITIHDNDLVDIDEVKNIERRLQDAIDGGTFIKQTHEGPQRVFLKDLDVMDILGNLIEGNKCSLNKRYFKSLFLMLLSLYGHSVDPEHSYGVAPGALEHFETALRDPIYFGVVKRIVELFERYKNQLKSYTRDELIVPGVKIESVDVDKLITYYDDFEFNLNNAVEVNSLEEAEKLDIRVRQKRLNHKPVTTRITVNSDKATRVMVRVFLGPKYDYLDREMTLNEKRHYMVEVDRFPYDIVAGQNVIERSSRDSNAIVNDQITTTSLLKKIDNALEGKEPLYIGSTYRHCGFPERLLIPRGRKSGLPLNLYVVIAPYEGEDLNFHPSDITCGAGINYQNVDKRPFGYPFDRVIYEPYNFAVPNIYQKDVIVFHKTQEEINKA
ncbi:hexamerin-like [Anabrus simplex]|uniref:hexamerin-like n=1 Tax=Anabrus simplex TaxID=316456 RepID=UPI0035A3C563